ncbi:hypothetical protein SDC9_151641 [bioreactor metagenome]|uniref:Uncharacterized protein n=1 Tax=bioreactor metagenome TaxID=1076179 RepID=A0A645EV75_9ZZZZ
MPVRRYEFHPVLASKEIVFPVGIAAERAVILGCAEGIAARLCFDKRSCRCAGHRAGDEDGFAVVGDLVQRHIKAFGIHLIAFSNFRYFRTDPVRACDDRLDGGLFCPFLLLLPEIPAGIKPVVDPFLYGSPRAGDSKHRDAHGDQQARSGKQNLPRDRVVLPLFTLALHPRVIHHILHNSLLEQLMFRHCSLAPFHSARIRSLVR